MSPAELLNAALAHVDSESIRAWVLGQQRAWRCIAQHSLDRKDGDVDPVEFASYIMLRAMGA